MAAAANAIESSPLFSRSSILHIQSVLTLTSFFLTFCNNGNNGISRTVAVRCRIAREDLLQLPPLLLLLIQYCNHHHLHHKADRFSFFFSLVSSSSSYETIQEENRKQFWDSTRVLPLLRRSAIFLLLLLLLNRRWTSLVCLCFTRLTISFLSAWFLSDCHSGMIINHTVTSITRFYFFFFVSPFRSTFKSSHLDLLPLLLRSIKKQQQQLEQSSVHRSNANQRQSKCLKQKSRSAGAAVSVVLSQTKCHKARTHTFFLLTLSPSTFHTSTSLNGHHRAERWNGKHSATLIHSLETHSRLDKAC